MAKSTRNIMRIDLSGDAFKRFSRLSDDNGMTQVAMMSRLIEWFATQDRAVQAAVMDTSAKSNPELSKMIFKALAGTK